MLWIYLQREQDSRYFEKLDILWRPNLGFRRIYNTLKLVDALLKGKNFRIFDKAIAVLIATN